MAVRRQRPHNREVLPQRGPPTLVMSVQEVLGEGASRVESEWLLAASPPAAKSPWYGALRLILFDDWV